MPTAVNATTPTTSTSPSGSGANVLQGMGSDTFMKLLVAQLRYQNPFQPSDPSAMLGQVATYAQVEMLQSLSDNQAASTAMSQASMAADVIGKEVTALDAEGGEVSGVVTSTRFTPDGPVLVLDGSTEVTLTAVTVIGGQPEAPATTVTPDAALDAAPDPAS